LVQHNADGHEQLLAVPEVQRDAHGFAVGAARIGREHKAMPDTPAVTNRKLVERLATGAATLDDAAAARKAKTLPFGGTLDPYKHHTDLPAVAHLPRRGTELQPTAATSIPERLIPLFQAARRLVDEHSVAMSPDLLATLRGLHPDDVPEEQLAALATRLNLRARMRVVNGGRQ
jgi:hypothetical protein